jgi:glycosyltransferase involved in cell wall biosynthesis
MNKKILIWTTNIDRLLSPNDNKDLIVGGILVQMYMWSVTFLKNGWNVYSFTINNENSYKKIDNIYFIRYPLVKFLNPLLSIFFIFYLVTKLQPDLILIPGAKRDLFFVKLVARVWKVKVILRFASDTDLIPGQEIMRRNHDKLLFRWGIKISDNFIVQNQKQSILLKNNYNKDNPLLIPNIWSDNIHIAKTPDEKKTILWVSNFKKIKRPEWFIDLAIKKPFYNYIMVGFPIDNVLYERCKKMAKDMPNLSFMGGLSFMETNNLFKQARLFICTSEVEGFPNTFLQAWINECPVISTFDPSNLIKDLNLGVYCKSFDDILKAIELMDNNMVINEVQENIKNYFNSTHNPQLHYERLIEKFGLS